MSLKLLLKIQKASQKVRQKKKRLTFRAARSSAINLSIKNNVKIAFQNFAFSPLSHRPSSDLLSNRRNPGDEVAS